MASGCKLDQQFAFPSRLFRQHRRRRPVLEVLEGRALLATFTVKSLGDVGSGSGDSGDVRYCINQANADDQANTIVFDPTMFSTRRTITLTQGQLELEDTGGTQTIAGPAAGVTLSGGGISRDFQVDDGVTASLSGLTISGGSASGNGGGLVNYGTATLTDCTISGNTVNGTVINGYYGYYGYHGPHVNDPQGGGVFNGGWANMTLTDCTISGNTAFAETETPGQGYNIYYNFYGNGGGVFNSGTAILTDCTVSGNDAGGAGFAGAGLDSFGTATLTDCTISGNAGGGEYNGGTATLTDTIVAGNTGGDIGGPTNVSGSYNLIGTGGSGGLANGVDGNVVLTSVAGLDLAPLGNFGGPTQTIALLPGSPAIGAGVIADYPGTATPVTTDQRGEPLDSPNPDIGAFQTQDPTLIPLAFSGTSDQSITFGTSSVTISGLLAVGSQAPVGETVAVTLDSLQQPATIGSGGAFSTTFDATGLTQASSPYTVSYAFMSDGTFASASTTSTLTVMPTLAIFTVNSLGDAGNGAGDSGDLRYCINQANSDDQANTIVFDSIVFNTPQTISLSGTQLWLEDTSGTQTFTGPAAGVTISGGGTSRLFQVDGGVTASISGLTISGGSEGLLNYGAATLTDCTISGNASGGVANTGNLSLTDCTISGNSAFGSGGGVDNTGNLTLTDCTVSGNNGFRGGGVFNNGTANLIDCTVSDNMAGSSGGGVFNLGTANLTLTDCTVSGNDAVNDGGGLSNYGGTTTLINCTFSGNDAEYGGGACNYFSTASLTLTDCTVSSNNAEDSGGGVFNYGTANLTDCTFSGNSAANSGGGVWNFGTVDLTACTLSGNSASRAAGLMNRRFHDFIGEASLTDTIVAGNTGGDIGGRGRVSGSHNLIGTGGSGGLANGVDGNIVLTSLVGLGLAPLDNYSGPTQAIALLPGSPALGAGIAVDGVTTDQRGEPLDSPNPDIGAFQSQGFTVTPVAGSTPQSAATDTAFANPLAVTVTANNSVEPVAGGILTFAAPAHGPSANLSATTATIGLSGVASLTATANATAGSYTVTASAGGANAAAEFALTNTRSSVISTSTSLGSSLDPSVFGQAVTFTATVTPVSGSGTPEGNVTFYDGSTALATVPLTAGAATYTTAKLPTGRDSITAVYGGSSTFAPSTSAASTQTINQAATATQVTSSVNPSVHGHAVTFTARVKAVAPGSGTPTGTVTFYDGTTVLGTGSVRRGIATFTTSSLSVGTHAVTAVYSGETNFQTSTSADLEQVVNAAGSRALLVLPVDPTDFGMAVLPNDTDSDVLIETLAIEQLSARRKLHVKATHQLPSAL